MHRALAPLLVALACLQPGWAAARLGEQTLRRLIVMEDVEAAPLLAEQITWLDQGGMLVGGWRSWPDQPDLICFDGQGLRLPAAIRPLRFFPLFALSPSADRLACWQRPAEQGEAAAQLMAVDLRTGAVAPLVGPTPFASAGPLLMLADGTVIASYQAEGGGAVLLRVPPDGTRQTLAQFDDQVCEGLLVEPGETYLVARCPGDVPHYYRIELRTGLWAEAAPQLYEQHDPDRLPPGVSLDAEGRLVRRVIDEDVVLATEVEAACSRPGSEVVIYASQGGLWVMGPTGQTRRQLWGAEPLADARAHKLSWCPGGVYLAHCYRRNYTGAVRRAALGTEEVKVRLSLPAESKASDGDRAWVAERFQFDDAGQVTEPVWSTLKALLRVEHLARSDQGFVVEAVSEGLEGGVVERLTGSDRAPAGAGGHIAIGAAGAPPGTWVQTFTAQPRPGLRAWVEGDTFVGPLLSVVVTRRRLAPLE